MTAPKNNDSYENFAGELGLGTTHVEFTPAKISWLGTTYNEDGSISSVDNYRLPDPAEAAVLAEARRQLKATVTGERWYTRWLWPRHYTANQLLTWIIVAFQYRAEVDKIIKLADAETKQWREKVRLLEQGPEFKAAEQPAAVTPLAPPYCAPPEENMHLKNAQEQLKAYRAWEKQLVDHARDVENVCGVEPSLQNLITHGPGTRLFMPAARPVDSDNGEALRKVWKEQPNENLADAINSSSSPKHGADAVHVLHSIPDDDGADGTVRERSRRAVPSPAGNTSIEVGSAGARSSERAAPLGDKLLALAMYDIPLAFLQRLGAIIAKGERNHGKGNYRKGFNDPAWLRDRFNHAVNHLAYWRAGRMQNDQEDDIAAVAWFCMAMLEADSAGVDVISTMEAQPAPAALRPKKVAHWARSLGPASQSSDWLVERLEDGDPVKDWRVLFSIWGYPGTQRAAEGFARRLQTEYEQRARGDEQGGVRQ